MNRFNKIYTHFILSLIILPTCMQASLVASLRNKVARACTVRTLLARNGRSLSTNTFDRTSVTSILSGSRQPLTLHDYNVLSKGQKNAAHELAEEHLSIKTDSETLTHPTLDKAKREELIDEAIRLGSEHPTHSIYGLGQSPAFLIETAKAHAFLTRKNPHRFRHVAFSGSFFERRLTGRHGVLTFDKISSTVPTQQQAEAYREYLYGLYLTAHQIAKAPQKTLIVDNVVTGGGLASFLHTLRSPADTALRSELERALELRIYPAQSRLQPVNFDYPTKRITDHATIVEEFGHWRNVRDIRLMPFFDHLKWGAEQPSNYRIPLAAQLACFKMIDHLATTPRVVKK